MCGIFAFFSNNPEALNQVHSRKDTIASTIRLRGPDKTTVLRDRQFIAIHTLLSMTGFLREQPIVNEEMLLLYNGEVYNDYINYHDSYGDADFLKSHLLENHHPNFQQLDGEFAICVFSFSAQKVYLATDPFGTKPLYYQIGPRGCVVGSYESTLVACGESGNICQVPANTILEISLDELTLQSQTSLKTFDFSSQTETDFCKWNESFTQSIDKRTSNNRHQCFVGFSSGHDSGLIAADLLNRNIPFAIYTIPYKEDQEVLEKRIQILRQHHIPCYILEPSSLEIEKMKQLVLEHCDPFQLINLDSAFQNFKNPDMRILSGYIASAIIHQQARNAGRLISLSGQGADEIFCDYFNPHSNPAMSEIRGEWEGVTGPWKNFFGGWNRVFIGGGERIAGLFGIETRYPYLDVQVVQEFVNLHPKLKSEIYKAPITNRLKELDFPLHYRKFGFAGYPEEKGEMPPSTAHVSLASSMGT